MSGKEFLEALGDISDEKLQCAMNIRRRKRSGGGVWIRVACVAATLVLVLLALLMPRDDGIVTAPGVLQVYAYDLSSGEIDPSTAILLKEGVVQSDAYGWCGLDSYGWGPGLPLTLILEEAELAEREIAFRVSVEIGGICYRPDPTDKFRWGKQFTVLNGDTIGWTNNDLDSPGFFLEDCYMDIVITADATSWGIPL